MSNETRNKISNMTNGMRKYETKRTLKKGSGSPEECLQNKVNFEQLQKENPITTKYAKLCKTLGVKSEEVVPVRIKGLTGNMVPLMCHLNVSWLCKRYGGKRVTGWYLKRVEGHEITLNHHSVWRTPEGKLADPTLSTSGRKKDCRFLVLDESGFGAPITVSYWNFAKEKKFGYLALSGNMTSPKQVTLNRQSFRQLKKIHPVVETNDWSLLVAHSDEWFIQFCNIQKSIGNPIPKSFAEIDADAKIAA